MNTSGAVVCRARPVANWLLALGLGEAAFMLAGPFLIALSNPPGVSDWPVWLVFGPIQGLILYGLGYYALHLTKGFIRADANGLSWRSAFKTRSVTWDGVTDFYDVASPHKARNFVIEARSGILNIDGHWTSTPELRDFVLAHATQSKSREWVVQAKHRRAKDRAEPAVFHYTSWENRWFMPFITLSGLLGPLCIFSVLFFQPQTLHSDLRGLGILPAILLVCGKIGVAFSIPILYWFTFVPLALELRRRRNERITATPTGLIFEDTEQRIEMDWHDITNFYIAPSPLKLQKGVYVVESRDAKFDFLREIAPYRGLQDLIQERATNSAAREWKVLSARDIETLGGEGSKWRDGQRVHSYRTRYNRAVLWFPTVLSVFLPFVFWSLRQPWLQSDTSSVNDQPNAIAIAVVMIGLLAFTFGGWWVFYRFSIRTDEHGLTKTGWRGEEFVPWNDVVDFYSRDGVYYIITKSGKGVRFSGTVGDIGELRDTIVQRAGLGEHRAQPAAGLRPDPSNT